MGPTRVTERQIEGDAPMPYFDVEQWHRCYCPRCPDDGHWIRLGGSSERDAAERWAEQREAA